MDVSLHGTGPPRHVGPPHDSAVADITVAVDHRQHDDIGGYGHRRGVHVAGRCGQDGVKNGSARLSELGPIF